MRRRAAGDTAALTVGTLASGVFAYVFFAQATRALGPRPAAPISVLWTFWSAAAAVLTFPVQHWIIRRLSAEGDEGLVRRSLPRLWIVVAGLAAAVAAGSWLLRRPLFGHAGVLFPLMAALVTLGSCAVGVARGGLAGRRRFVATAWVIGGENGVRVIGGAAAAALGGGATAFGVALVAGPLIALLWPSAFRYAAPVRASSPPAPRRVELGFVGEIAGGALIAQIVLTGGPVALALLGGAAAEVTSLFAALALLRAPYVLALGLVTRLTGTLTRLVVGGRADRLAAVRRWTILGVVAGGLVGAAFGWTVAESLLGMIFGSGVALPPPLIAVLGAGTACGLGNLVLTLLLVARERSRPIVAAWLAAVAASVVVVAVVAPAPLEGVVWGFFLAEAIAFALLAAAELSAR